MARSLTVTAVALLRRPTAEYVPLSESARREFEAMRSGATAAQAHCKMRGNRRSQSADRRGHHLLSQLAESLRDGLLTIVLIGGFNGAVPAV